MLVLDSTVTSWGEDLPARARVKVSSPRASAASAWLCPGGQKRCPGDSGSRSSARPTPAAGNRFPGQGCNRRTQPWRRFYGRKTEGKSPTLPEQITGHTETTRGAQVRPHTRGCGAAGAALGLLTHLNFRFRANNHLPALPTHWMVGLSTVGLSTGPEVTLTE